MTSREDVLRARRLPTPTARQETFRKYCTWPVDWRGRPAWAWEPTELSGFIDGVKRCPKHDVLSPFVYSPTTPETLTTFLHCSHDVNGSCWGNRSPWVPQLDGLNLHQNFPCHYGTASDSWPTCKLADLLTRSCKRSHVTQTLFALHWLLINFRIQFKVLVITYRALHGQARAP